MSDFEAENIEPVYSYYQTAYYECLGNFTNGLLKESS
jgi:hypothetical protein